MVHLAGEPGIDTGAISKEFYAKTIPEIGRKFFPSGSPVDSTSNIENSSLIACGEIVATSLSQGGPAPKFLDESVYMLMVNPDVNMCELDEMKQLTEAF